MMLLGMFIGPSYLNLVPQGTLEISSIIKDTALVIVLFIGGLGISLSQIKQIGRPAVLLNVVPATLEGFIIAAVSPAVLIPSMISLIDRKVGQDKAIPQMLLVGANGKSISIASQLISIPIAILSSVVAAFILFKISEFY